MLQTIIFLSCFLFVVVIFVFYNYYEKQNYYNPVLLNFVVKGSHYGGADNSYILDPKYLKTGVNLPLGEQKKKKVQMPEYSDTLEATYLMSLFIENNFEMNQDDQERCIITRNDSPGFYYEPGTNDFIIKIKHSNAIHSIKVANLIQQQRWITIGCVFNNRNLEIYSDGKLHTSLEISNVPQPDLSSVILFPKNGLYAQASYIHYFNKALEPVKVYFLSGKSAKPYWWLIA